MQFLTFAAIALIVPLVMRMLMAAKTEPLPGQLCYPRRLLVFSVVMGGLPPLVVAVAVLLQKRPLRPDEWPYVFGIAAFFPLLTLPILVEALGVRHRFDDAGIFFHSPWSKDRQLPWSEVRRVRWRNALKWLDLETGSGEVAHLSPMIGGLRGFAELALARLPPGLLAQDAEAHAVLQLMARNAHAGTAMSPLPPSQLWAELQRAERMAGRGSSPEG